MGMFLRYAMALALAFAWVRNPSLGAGNWTNLAPALPLSTHLAAGAATATGSVDLTIQHDAQCTLQVSVAQDGDEVLHNGTATLATAYRLTGAALGPGSDPDWVGANVFRTRTYTVYGAGPVDQITLSAQAIGPAGQAPDAGLYSATLILTLSW